MASLEDSADAQIPALRNLNANAEELEAFFKALAPFSDASRPATRALASAARAGRPALRAARPRIGELRSFARPLPEVTRNLTYVLEDLDDRGRSVEKDPRSPGGQGYTGFEALLQYVYDQTMAINVFDSNGYMLKVNLFVSECSEYQSLASLKEKLKEDPAFYQRCAAILGPHQPGITQPDPSYTGAQKGPEHHLPAAEKHETKKQQPARKPEPERADKPQQPTDKAAEELARRIEETLGIDLPDVPQSPEVPALPIPLPSLPQAPSGAEAQELLDFLLAP
jgi:hypothetical protein